MYTCYCSVVEFLSIKPLRQKHVVFNTILPAPTNYRESEGDGGEDGGDKEAGSDPVGLTDPRN